MVVPEKQGLKLAEFIEEGGEVVGISGGSRKTRIETMAILFQKSGHLVYKWWFQKNKD